MAKQIWISPSQIEDFQTCRRRWFLKSAKKLPVGEVKGSVFGDVFHGVCARFLSADDLGRDENGHAIDLYPAGWTVAYNRYTKEPSGEVTSQEAALIQTLVQRAIENGVLQRKPKRAIEWEFRYPIATPEGDALLVGFIDLVYPDEVHDHKTSSSRRWFKSQKALTKDTAMLIYAKVVIEQNKAMGLPTPQNILLRHNQFCKDINDPLVKFTEIRVATQLVEDEWAKIERDIVDMLRLKREAKKWSDCPDPKSFSEACNQYGGCAFVPICTGRETEERYIGRMQEQAAIRNTIPLNVLPNTGDTVASRFEELLKARQQQPQQQQPAQAMPAPQPQMSGAPAFAPPMQQAPASQFNSGGIVTSPTQQAPPMQQPMQITLLDQSIHFPQVEAGLVLPPWVNPEDPSKINYGVGFNHEGKVDIESRTKSTDRVNHAIQNNLPVPPHPDQFDIQNIGNGVVAWQGKGGSGFEHIQGRTRYRPPVEVAVQQKEAPPAPVQSTPPAVPQSPPPIQPNNPYHVAAVEASKKEVAKAITDVLANGFILCVNTAVVGNLAYIDLNEMVYEERKRLAQANGCDSFFQLDAFKRRDAMATWAEKLGPTLAGIVQIDGVARSDPDSLAVFTALRPMASGLIGPTVF